MFNCSLGSLEGQNECQGGGTKAREVLEKEGWKREEVAYVFSGRALGGNDCTKILEASQGVIRHVKRESVAANERLSKSMAVRDGASRGPPAHRHVLHYQVPVEEEPRRKVNMPWLDETCEEALKSLGIGGVVYLNHDCSKCLI